MAVTICLSSLEIIGKMFIATAHQLFSSIDAVIIPSFLVITFCLHLLLSLPYCQLYSFVVGRVSAYFSFLAFLRLLAVGGGGRYLFGFYRMMGRGGDGDVKHPHG